MKNIWAIIGAILIIVLAINVILPQLKSRKQAIRHHTLNRMAGIAKQLDELSPEQWPGQLAELNIKYEEQIIDMFTNREFEYHLVSRNGVKLWFLVSPGPDKVINSKIEHHEIAQFSYSKSQHGGYDYVYSTNFYPELNTQQPNTDFGRKGDWVSSELGWSRILAHDQVTTGSL